MTNDEPEETCPHIHQRITHNPDGTTFSTCLKCGAIDR